MSRRTRKVGVLDVSKAIGAMIVTYGDDVNEVVDDAMKTVAEEAEESLRKVKTFSSKGNPTGEYSKDWDLLIEPVKRYSRRFVVYNVDHYQLTHLLESGHAKYLWGKETGGQVQDYEHIKPINDKAQDRIIEEIIERVTDLNS